MSKRRKSVIFPKVHRCSICQVRGAYWLCNVCKNHYCADHMPKHICA